MVGAAYWCYGTSYVRWRCHFEEGVKFFRMKPILPEPIIYIPQNFNFCEVNFTQTTSNILHTQLTFQLQLFFLILLGRCIRTGEKRFAINNFFNTKNCCLFLLTLIIEGSIFYCLLPWNVFYFMKTEVTHCKCLHVLPIFNTNINKKL